MFLLTAQFVPQQHTTHLAGNNIHRQHLHMIACYRAGLYGLDQPLRHQPFGEFALPIFKVEN